METMTDAETVEGGIWTMTDAEFKRELATAKAEALEEAAGDASLRLSGHSGISITRLRARATDVRAAS